VSRLLPQWRRWETKYGSLEEIAEYAHQSLKKHKQFQAYLKERKIYDFMEEGVLGHLDGWTTFPIFDRVGEIIDLVVRSSSGGDMRYVVRPSGDGSTHPLYAPSWKNVDRSESIYVVYGLIDAISMHLAGLACVTGVTGKSLSPDLLKPLGKRFIIVPDDGEEAEAHKLANKLGWRCKVKKIKWLENTKDCDDIRRLYGNEALLSALA
jgi:DNA primase